MFRANYLDDVIFEVVSCYSGLSGLGLRVNGPVWETNLELRFYCAGYGKKSDENYKRGLAEAIESNSGIAKSLFSMKPRSFPARWLEPLTDKDMGDGLTLIEKSYARHLPKDYVGWGLNLKQKEGRVGSALRDEFWIQKLGDPKNGIQRVESKSKKTQAETEDTE